MRRWVVLSLIHPFVSFLLFIAEWILPPDRSFHFAAILAYLLNLPGILLLRCIAPSTVDSPRDLKWWVILLAVGGTWSMAILPLSWWISQLCVPFEEKRREAWRITQTLYRGFSVASLAVIWIAAALFTMQGHSGNIPRAVYVFLGLLTIGFMTAASIFAIGYGLRQHKMPWTILVCMVVALFSMLADWRGTRVYCRDVFGFDLPAEFKLEHREKHDGETLLELTIPKISGEKLQQEGISGYSYWMRGYRQPADFRVFVAGRYGNLPVLLRHTPYGVNIVAYDEAKHRLVLYYWTE